MEWTLTAHDALAQIGRVQKCTAAADHLPPDSRTKESERTVSAAVAARLTQHTAWSGGEGSEGERREASLALGSAFHTEVEPRVCAAVVRDGVVVSRLGAAPTMANLRILTDSHRAVPPVCTTATCVPPGVPFEFCTIGYDCTRSDHGGSLNNVLRTHSVRLRLPRQWLCSQSVHSAE